MTIERDEDHSCAAKGCAEAIWNQSSLLASTPIVGKCVQPRSGEGKDKSCRSVQQFLG